MANQQLESRLPEDLLAKFGLNRFLAYVRDAIDDQIQLSMPNTIERALANPTGTYQEETYRINFKLNDIGKTTRSIKSDTLYIRKKLDKLEKKNDELDFGLGLLPFVGGAYAAIVGFKKLFYGNKSPTPKETPKTIEDPKIKAIPKEKPLPFEHWFKKSPKTKFPKLEDTKPPSYEFGKNYLQKTFSAAGKALTGLAVFDQFTNSRDSGKSVSESATRAGGTLAGIETGALIGSKVPSLPGKLIIGGILATIGAYYGPEVAGSVYNIIKKKYPSTIGMIENTTNFIGNITEKLIKGSSWDKAFVRNKDFKLIPNFSKIGRAGVALDPMKNIISPMKSETPRQLKDRKQKDDEAFPSHFYTIAYINDENRTDYGSMVWILESDANVGFNPTYHIRYLTPPDAKMYLEEDHIPANQLTSPVNVKDDRLNEIISKRKKNRPSPNGWLNRVLYTVGGKKGLVQNANYQVNGDNNQSTQNGGHVNPFEFNNVQFPGSGFMTAQGMSPYGSYLQKQTSDDMGPGQQRYYNSDTKGNQVRSYEGGDNPVVQALPDVGSSTYAPSSRFDEKGIGKQNFGPMTTTEAQSRAHAEKYLGRKIRDDEWDALKRITFAESGHSDPKEVAMVMGSVLNRAKSGKYGDIIGVIKAKNQFEGYGTQNYNRGPTPDFSKLMFSSTKLLPGVPVNQTDFNAASIRTNWGDRIMATPGSSKQGGSLFRTTFNDKAQFYDQGISIKESNTKINDAMSKIGRKWTPINENKPGSQDDTYSKSMDDIIKKTKDSGFTGSIPQIIGIGKNVKPLEKTPGNPSNIKDVDPRLLEITAAAAAHLPKGYKVTINEGYTPYGHATKSQHKVKGKGALDLQITDPNGNVIRNEGNDPTGMYTLLARHSYGEMLARYPELKGKFAWGGAFGASSRNSSQDLMHFDEGGERGHYTKNLLSNLGPVDGISYGGVEPEKLDTQKDVDQVQQKEIDQKKQQKPSVIDQTKYDIMKSSPIKPELMSSILDGHEKSGEQITKLEDRIKKLESVPKPKPPDEYFEPRLEGYKNSKIGGTKPALPDSQKDSKRNSVGLPPDVDEPAVHFINI